MLLIFVEIRELSCELLMEYHLFLRCIMIIRDKYGIAMINIIHGAIRRVNFYCSLLEPPLDLTIFVNAFAAFL